MHIKSQIHVDMALEFAGTGVCVCGVKCVFCCRESRHAGEISTPPPSSEQTCLCLGGERIALVRFIQTMRSTVTRSKCSTRRATAG